MRPSSGVTMLELLLVLALLVIVGATVMPNVGGTLANHRLRRSADLIRAAFSKAKAKAMETGRTYVFRYERSGDGFVIEPWYSDEDYLESEQLGVGTNSMAAPAASMSLTEAPASSMRHLPEDIEFVASDSVQETRDMLALQEPAAAQAADATMSEPIFFYADGTSSTARVLVKNQRSRYILLTLRGLTGVVYVSDPLTEEQVR